jgi:hypothetical protein
MQRRDGHRRGQGRCEEMALGFMTSLSEAKPATVGKVDGWTVEIVRRCLERMGELPDDNLEFVLKLICVRV